MVLRTESGRELVFIHPPKPRSSWRPGESRIERAIVDVVDLRDRGFHLRLTRQEAEDIILMLELRTSEMADSGA